MSFLYFIGAIILFAFAARNVGMAQRASSKSD
jgi:hypothetical protein